MPQILFSAKEQRTGHLLREDEVQIMTKISNGTGTMIDFFYIPWVG
jgi:hypothetical protein